MLLGTSAIPRGLGAGAGPTDASLGMAGTGGRMGKSTGGFLGLALGPLFGIGKHPHNYSHRHAWGNGRGKDLDWLCPDPQQMQAGPPPLSPHAWGRLKPREASPSPSAAPRAGLEMAPVVARTSPKGGERLPASWPPCARQDPAVEGQPGHGPRLWHVLLEEVPDLQVGLQCPQGGQLLQRFLA